MRVALDETQLRALLNTKESSALGSENSSISQDRQKALRRYRGDLQGNEVKGRSRFISTDTQDAVEGVLPSILRVFFSGETIVEFSPMREEDEDIARQATDYINYIFTKDNNGFLAFYNAIKDSLIMRTGLIKHWWDSGEETVINKTEGIDDNQLAILELDEDIEITETTPRDEDVDPALGLIDETGEVVTSRTVFDVTYKRTLHKGGRVRIEAVPPDEFLIDTTAKSIDDTPYAAHVTFKTEGELVSQLDSFPGITRKDIQNLPTSQGQIFNTGEREERFATDGSIIDRTEQTSDRTSRLIRVVEHYVKVDWDDDGIPELRMVMTAGESVSVILQNEVIDRIPITDFTPILMPHKFTGRSMDDLTRDIQEIKTAVTRQLLDNYYLSNHNRWIAVKGQVNMNDLLAPRPDSVIRVDQPGALVPVQPPSLGSSPFNLLEYMDSQKESRTGVTRTNQGLEADTLNKTATGISLLLSASQQRIELITRIYAESMKRLFKAILEIICRHQTSERIIRLRDEWIPIDPRCWNSNMDVSITVALGSGTKEQQQQQLLNIHNLQIEAMQLQQGVEGPIVGIEELHSVYSRIVETAGFQNPDAFFKQPPTEEEIAQQQALAQQQAQAEALAAQQEQGLAPGNATAATPLPPGLVGNPAGVV